MPEYKMCLMTDGEKRVFDSITIFFRKISENMPELREEYYEMANRFQELTDRIWDSGFEIDQSELTFGERIENE